MNKNFIGKALILCGATALCGSLFLLKDSFLHAEEQENSISATKDATQSAFENNETYQQDNDIIPAEIQGVTLTINEAQGNEIPDLIVTVNGNEYSYGSSDFVNNVLTLNIDDSYDQIIELKSDQYYFEPAYLMIDHTNMQGNYDFQAFAGKAPDATEGVAIFGADATQKDVFDNDETVTVSISSKFPLHRVYYQIENDPWKSSDNDTFTITARQQGEHEVSVAYDVVYFYPDVQEPNDDSFNEPNDPERISVKFAAADNSGNNDPDNPDGPDDPTDTDQEEESFIGEDGNTYTKDDIKLSVEEMDEADYEKYQRVIAYFDEFKDIPAAQITYYQAALYAQDVRVQPNAMYDLLLPYPGSSSADKEFVIYQFKDGNTDHADLLSYTADDDGLHVKVDNVSAFIVGWKNADKTTNTQIDENKKAETKPDDNTTVESGVNTGDATNIILWVFVLCTSYVVAMSIIRKKTKVYHQ